MKFWKLFLSNFTISLKICGFILLFIAVLSFMIITSVLLGMWVASLIGKVIGIIVGIILFVAYMSVIISVGSNLT